jgi:hypothetical protein
MPARTNRKSERLQRLDRPTGFDVVADAPRHNILKHQLGAEWSKLHPNVQARFDREPDLGETIVYDGTMLEMRRSRMGWLFATLTRLVGNPLTPFEGRDIPMEVALYRKPGCAGVFWRRTYLRRGHKPYVVVSAKEESEKGEMLEVVGGGFGMKLRVSARDGDMHFISYRYFWKVFGHRLPLPHWLTPGRAHVIHHDMGQGRFMYTISMVHRQLGETFYQRGVFHKKGE